MKHTLFAIMLLASAFAKAAPQFTEEQVHHYRVSMQAANQDLQKGNGRAAFAKIKPLAEQGFPEAQYILGTLYHDGEGVAKDVAQARVWYQKAATQTSNHEIATLAKEALAELK